METNNEITAPKKGNRFSKSIMYLLGLLLIAGIAGGAIYLDYSSKRIKIDRAQISAPVIGLSPHAPGTLDEIFVHEGDRIDADAIVARVGSELIKSKVAGIVIDTKQDIGKIFNPGESVVTMIDPHDLRVVGSIEENKGLNEIKVGQ